MLRGFYTAASGMISQQRLIEMNTNNLANVNTPGFKADQSTLRAFPEMLLSRVEGTGKDSSSEEVGAINTGVYMQEGIPLMKQGDLRETRNNTDVAIWNNNMPVNPDTKEQGTVLFQVQSADGIAYTRNGNFTIDGKGFLTTNNGEFVLSSTGNPIHIQGKSFTLTEEGVILDGGLPVDQLGLAYANKPSDLTKLGNGLYGSENPLPTSSGANGETFTLKQGFVEGANVELQQTVANMMNSYRLFEMNQKALKSFDESMQKTVNEIGRIR